MTPARPHGDEPQAQIWTVDRLTLSLKALIEGRFRTVSVEGEVVNCRPASSGHVYFALRGRDAVLPCVAFRSTARRLTQPLRNGDRVVCSGAVELYPPHGKYQMVVSWVRLGGEGELLQALERLKRRLHDEGLFSDGRKRPLPGIPRRVGVITSPTGAAIRDIVRSIHIRYPIPILLAPAPVQGESAPARLVEALQTLAAVDEVDVIVIGRGGGSLHDLWCFNDEGLARAIAGCPGPVVSAVGHEIDTPISDLVADRRAATPTAVGELVVPVQADLRAHLSELERRAGQGLALTARHAKTRLRGLAARLRDPRRMVRDRMLRLDDLSMRAARALQGRMGRARILLQNASGRLATNHPLRQLAETRRRLDDRARHLTRNINGLITQRRRRLEALKSRLQALSPTAVLDRGYSIVRTEAGRVVRDSAEVATGDSLQLLLARGELDVTVVAAAAMKPTRGESS